ncbi:MAG: AAA family ATPase, partial [Prochlorococcaceae cyanobacterium]
EAVAGGVAEVLREVVDLVGLDADQFRQVILLPQGRFAEVLRARPEDREALLQTLFDTGLYERAAAWLEEQARAAVGEVLNGRRQLEAWRQEAWRLAEPWGPAAEPGAGAIDEPTAAPADQGQIEALLAAVDLQRQQAEGLRQRLDAAWEQARCQQLELLAAAERWDRRAEARRCLQDLELQAHAIAACRRQFDRAQQAEALRASLLGWRQARSQQQQLEQRGSDLLERSRRCRDQGAGLPDVLVALELLQLPPPSALTAALTALAAHRGDLDVLLALQADVHEASQSLAAAEAELADRSDRVLRGQQHVADCRSQLPQLEQQLLEARSARDGLEGLEQRQVRAQALVEAFAALQVAVRHEQQAQERHQRAERELLSCRQRELQLREQQIAGMAAQLAGGLQAGDPCPVCGSLDHPRPATGGAAPVATATIEAARARVAQAEQQQAREQAAFARVQGQRAALEAQVADADALAATSALAAARAAFEQARLLVQALPACEASLEAAQRQLASFETRLQEVCQEQAAAGERVRAEQQRRASLEARLAARLP